MDDEWKWILVLAGIIVVAIIIIIIVSSFFKVLGERPFLYGLLVGIPVGVGLTFGGIYIRRWFKTHRIVKREE